jgi:acetylornithine deacetylase/succinyl-diaminopimelate desuccinylase-like protein
VSAPTLIIPDDLIHNLRELCAQPSTSGDLPELELTARLVKDMMHHVGLDAKIVRAGGAPIIIGWRHGRRPHTLLLYHHYDVVAPGPWRAWQHEPFQVAERDNYVYGRGVAYGKGPLVSHLMAIQSLLSIEDELPHGIVFVVEGENLTGSPHLGQVIKHYTEQLHVHTCLSTGGERDVHGYPFCYSGSKGLLRVRLSAKGADIPLPPALAASVNNPAWRIVWALSSIKGGDEDIRINGFYDNVEGPGRDERSALRHIQLDENGRQAAWHISEFLFGMSGSTLVRTEVTLPTCNLSSFTVDSPNGVSSIPTAASAHLDFHLVPDQHPDAILGLLRKHLIERGLKDIVVEKLPGGYSPVHCSSNQPFYHTILDSAASVYHASPTILPFGLFTHPLHAFAHHLQIPVAVLAVARHDSTEYGANEHIPLDDLVLHGQMLIEMMVREGEVAREVALL